MLRVSQEGQVPLATMDAPELLETPESRAVLVHQEALGKLGGLELQVISFICINCNNGIILIAYFYINKRGFCSWSSLKL